MISSHRRIANASIIGNYDSLERAPRHFTPFHFTIITLARHLALGRISAHYFNCLLFSRFSTLSFLKVICGCFNFFTLIYFAVILLLSLTNILISLRLTSVTSIRKSCYLIVIDFHKMASQNYVYAYVYIHKQMNR